MAYMARFSEMYSLTWSYFKGWWSFSKWTAQVPCCGIATEIC